MDISYETAEGKRNYNEPIYTKDLSEHGQILSIEFSQYDWSQDMILVGFQSKILLGYLKFEENIELNILSEFPFPSRCSCLNISPESNLNILPKGILFCAAGADFKIRIFKTDLKEDNVCKILNGHNNYINDIKFDPENKYLSSVSDDNTVKIWETLHYKCIATLFLSSPGIATYWHRDDSSKLLVGEKTGIIRFYNVETLQPILSVDVGKPLSSCHWSPSNSQLVCSLQLGELNIWDLTAPSVPRFESLLFTEMGGYVKFSPQGDAVAGINSLEGTLKIINSGTQQQRFSTAVTLPTNLCWHYRYPVICIGEDNKLCFWKVNL